MTATPQDDDLFDGIPDAGAPAPAPAPTAIAEPPAAPAAPEKAPEKPAAEKKKKEKAAPAADNVVATGDKAPATQPKNAETTAPAGAITAPKRITLHELVSEHLQIIARLDAIATMPRDAAHKAQIEAQEALIYDEMEALAKRLEKADPEIDKKIEGWGKWIGELEGDHEKVKAEADRLKHRAGVQERAVKKLRETLCMAMILLDREKVKTPILSVYTQKSPPSAKLVDGKVGDIPNRFIRPPAPIEARVDFAAILEEYKLTGKNPCPGAVEIDDTRKHVRIK